MMFRNSVLEDVAIHLAENFRDIKKHDHLFKSHIDPLKIEHLDISLADVLSNIDAKLYKDVLKGVSIEEGKVSIKNLVAKNLNDFVIDDFRFLSTENFPNLTVEMKGHVPSVEVTADEYRFEVIVNGVRIQGKGRASVKVFEPRFKMLVDTELSLKRGASVSIRNCQTALQTSSVKSKIQGIFDSSEVTDNAVNDFVLNVVPEVLSFFEDDISDTIDSVLRGFGHISVLPMIPLASVTFSATVAKVIFNRVVSYLSPDFLPKIP